MEKTKETDLSKATSHYGSLFSLPRYSSITIINFLVSIIGSLVAFAIAYRSLQKIIEGFVFGLQVLIIPTIVADFFLSKYINKNDIVLDERRGAGLSLFICGMWVTSINVGAVLQLILKTPSLLFYASLFAVGLAISFRYLIVSAVTYIESWKFFVTILLQPALVFLSSLFFFDLWHPNLFSAVLVSSIVILSSSYIFIRLIDNKGLQAIGIGNISLLKAFLVNWIADVTKPLEKHLDELGSNSNVLISLLAFKKGESIESVIVVPMIHPGPFKNLGSSNLPYLLQSTIKDKINGIVAVPHGTCSHVLNLTSQEQCRKVISETISLTNFSDFKLEATRFVREEKKLIKASCQIFGDVALITLTCAPANMEDVPKEIGVEIIERGKKLGVKDVIVIDAHNSLLSSSKFSVLSKETLKDIVYVAEKALKTALKEERLPFKVGVSEVPIEEFSVKEGIGPGGIVALTVIVGEQKIAYVIIDGNNMISGFREEILRALKDTIHDGEILTTDTHVVNAVLPIDQGYYTIGEAIDRRTLISYIKKAVSQASNNIDFTATAYKISEIKDIKVLGKKILNLSILIDLTYRYMKKLVPLIYIPSISIALLVFITILFNMMI